jgi:hypothetical protein
VLVLNYLNGECFVIRGFYKYTLLASTEFNLTVLKQVSIGTTGQVSFSKMGSVLSLGEVAK